eukprot:NP_001021739.3 Uncharacterized protein CELE_Y26D4A.13 [Caenorhabditis elegans]
MDKNISLKNIPHYYFQNYPQIVSNVSTNNKNRFKGGLEKLHVYANDELFSKMYPELLNKNKSNISIIKVKDVYCLKQDEKLLKHCNPPDRFILRMKVDRINLIKRKGMKTVIALNNLTNPIQRGAITNPEKLKINQRSETDKTSKYNNWIDDVKEDRTEQDNFYRNIYVSSSMNTIKSDSEIYSFVSESLKKDVDSAAYKKANEIHSMIISLMNQIIEYSEEDNILLSSLKTLVDKLESISLQNVSLEDVVNRLCESYKKLLVRVAELETELEYEKEKNRALQETINNSSSVDSKINQEKLNKINNDKKARKNYELNKIESIINKKNMDIIKSLY